MTDTTTTGTVTFEHGGAAWQIPLDLIAVQQEFDATEAECQAIALTPNPTAADAAAYREASGRRLDAVLALYRHDWWAEHSAAGRRYQADRALKAAARGSKS